MALRVVGGAMRRGLVAVGGGGRVPAAPRPTPALSATLQHQPQRSYAMRLELTEHGIIWKRPEYVPSWKPEKSGDLMAYEHPKEERVKVALLPGKDYLEDVDEVTKQLLSLKFGNYCEKVRVSCYDLMRDIQRHQYDTGSLEVTIAMLTVRIRKAQQELLETKKGKKHTTKQRVTLQETIDRRKKLLKHLRRMDYKRFEWLINRLGILYRPPPRYVRWVTRKISLRRLVRMHGTKVRTERLRACREELESQKEGFLKEKAETLKWIADTERSLGLPVSVEVPGGEGGSSSSSSSFSSSSSVSVSSSSS